MELTERQLDLYLVIKEYIENYGYSPTVRELCKLNEVNSPATIHYGLKQLKKKGYIDYQYNRNRTLRITKEVEYGKY